MGHNVAHLFASVCFSKMPKNMPQAILGYLNPQNWIMSMTYDLRARRVARNNSSYVFIAIAQLKKAIALSHGCCILDCPREPNQYLYNLNDTCLTTKKCIDEKLL